VSPDRTCERPRLPPWAGVAFALERAQRRPHEELEPDQGGDRVAGQSENECRTPRTERHRLAGLDGHAPEDLLDAELARDAPNEVVRADRDAARADDDVGSERALERLA